MAATHGRGTITRHRALVRERYAQGERLAAIARDLGLSRQGLVAMLQREPDYKILEDRHLAVLAAVPTYEERKRAIVRERRWHTADTKPGQRIPDETLLEHLREWQRRHGDPVTTNRWRQVADPTLVSGAAIIQRFPSWNEAKTRAGLTVTLPKRTYRQRWSKEDCLAWTVRFVIHARKFDENPTYIRADAWLQTQGSSPSAQTIRNRYGGKWSNAVQAALDALNQRD